MKRMDSMLYLQLWMCLSLSLFSLATWAAPCTTDTAMCTEWVTVGGGPERALVYRTYSLDVKNEGITRALVVIHGGERNAGNQFRNALAAGFLAGALENTVVISPRFASNYASNCRDTLATNELNWKCQWEPDDWRVGGASVDNAKITSFDVADEILRKLARKEAFPNLRTIVVAGHSGGGSFVIRYEMANQVHDRLGVPITYVAANPPHYTFLDGLRPAPSAVPPTVAAAAPGVVPLPSTKPPALFMPFSDAANCIAYNEWPYGLQNRTGYSARLTDEQLKRQLVARRMTYLVGELDIFPIANLDVSCPAMAQGPTRLARGLAFGNYVNEKFGAQHKTQVVRRCGHDARCMFTAEPVLPLMFPKE